MIAIPSPDDCDPLQLAERLADAPRPGAPPTFTPEQICAILALAYEDRVRKFLQKDLSR
jgi:hypothetical protein